MSLSADGIQGELVLAVQITVKPGRGDELLPWITKLKAQVAGEKDTFEYTFARDKPDGDVFVIWERYASVEAWQKHSSSDLLRSWMACELFAKQPEVKFYHGNIGAH
ncbi:uncharacterized protein STEHIDRAFT_122059 [Stereum hirsutum FP-91666 SS1]|uniref:uncharacterized protein n=1 Tax=Stereum hirsutum (strain FP-91666) TaxID=721885 RepID=UPI000444A52E|nr:uncharacterized protein STEHIDRAFT_122059 [Stereum hirsutum FP-91666 SS1]EIM86076.1 hypothetical protein STEHIDRAFT_122059 [Stereum hirsutum FP-91666 SS1]